MGIMRMGYIHTRVTDLAEAKSHYANTLGLYETQAEDGRVWYKGWDEWDHHSVVLEEGGVGVVKYGFKVQYLDDIDQIEKKAKEFGVKTERFSKGEVSQVGDGLRVYTPSEHIFEIYHEMTSWGLEVGTHNPEAFPRHLVGVGVPALDHSLITCEDPGLMEKFMAQVFDFYTAEKVMSSLEDDAETLGVWMTPSNSIHQLAIIGGPNGKLHHFAFQMTDWNDILRAADLFTMDDVPKDIGPTRHGITRGTTVYFFDPSGNRNEVFAGGYMAYPDRPCVIWTADQLGRGIFYHDRELNESFTTVLT